MMISTRGRYALRVLLDLAEHRERGYIPMKEAAERQGISLKYLERIVPCLVKAGYIEGVHGKGGGYRLKKLPEECRVGDILRLTEGDLAPVSCLCGDAGPCEREKVCRTRPLWTKLYGLMNEFLDGITLQELL